MKLALATVGGSFGLRYGSLTWIPVPCQLDDRMDSVCQMAIDVNGGA